MRQCPRPQPPWAPAVARAGAAHSALCRLVDSADARSAPLDQASLQGVLGAAASAGRLTGLPGAGTGGEEGSTSQVVEGGGYAPCVVGQTVGPSGHARRAPRGSQAQSVTCGLIHKLSGQQSAAPAG